LRECGDGDNWIGIGGSAKSATFGSPSWQKEVCILARIQAPYTKQFWSRKGMTEARVAMNRKRQNTTIVMKKTFMGSMKRTGALSHLLCVCNALCV
jgi:hypothetical protein